MITTKDGVRHVIWAKDNSLRGLFKNSYGKKHVLHPRKLKITAKDVSEGKK